MSSGGGGGVAARSNDVGDEEPFDTAPKIFVGGVPFEMDGEELRAMFAKFGTITEITVRRHGGVFLSSADAPGAAAMGSRPWFCIP